MFQKSSAIASLFQLFFNLETLSLHPQIARLQIITSLGPRSDLGHSHSVLLSRHGSDLGLFFKECVCKLHGKELYSIIANDLAFYLINIIFLYLATLATFSKISIQHYFEKNFGRVQFIILPIAI
jgi:hypothetical protein